MIGDRIQSRLDKLGMSQAALARAVGVSQPTIARLIAGDARGSSHMHKIARHLATTVDYLVGDTDTPEATFSGHHLSEEEENLLAAIRGLSLRNRKAVKQLVEALSSESP